MRDAIQIPLLFLSLSLVASAQSKFPQTESVEPRVAKAGSVITIKGVALSSPRIDEIFLTDHRFDLKVKVLKQEDSVIEFRVPPFVKPGRLQLLYLTGGAQPAYLEQPFFVEIVDPADEVAPVITSATSKPAPVEVASTSPKIPVVATAAPAPATPPPPPPPAPNVPAATPVSEVVPARLVKRTPISLPPGAAASAAAFGEVHLIAMVRADGTVHHVKIVRGNPFLAQTAAAALRQWVYEPARVNGRAVESEVPVMLNLRNSR